MTVDPADYDICIYTLSLMLKKRRKLKSSLEKAQSELKHDRNTVFNYMFDAEKDLQKAVSQAREMQKVLAFIKVPEALTLTEDTA